MTEFNKQLRRIARRVKQRAQLDWFIAKADRSFAFSIGLAIISLIGGLFSVGSIKASGLNWGLNEKLSVFFFLVTLVSGLYAYSDRRQYTYGSSAEIAKTRVKRGTARFQTEVSFSDLKPASIEQIFEIATNKLISTDAFMRSAQYDDYLMNLPTLAFAKIGSRTGSYFSNDEELRRNQIRFLITRLKEAKKLPTTNDKKCGLSMQLGPPIADVKCYRVGYFDSLITNEAFRSEIYRASRLIDQDTGLGAADRSINLTRNFPASTNAEGEFILDPLNLTGAGNHIGATCVFITGDHRVLLFRQGDTQIGRGTITGASGSIDWKDVRRGSNSDLLKVIRRAMAREFCEEASAQKAYRAKLDIRTEEQRITHAMQTTVITGFFRWVDRCGKPEFVGVARTPFMYDELPPDEFEVTAFHVQGISRFLVKRMQDFKTLLREIQSIIKQDNELKMGLSTFIALQRLCEIAEYRDSADSYRVQVYKNVKTKLGLE